MFLPQGSPELVPSLGSPRAPVSAATPTIVLTHSVFSAALSTPRAWGPPSAVFTARSQQTAQHPALSEAQEALLTD